MQLAIQRRFRHAESESRACRQSLGPGARFGGERLSRHDTIIQANLRCLRRAQEITRIKHLGRFAQADDFRQQKGRAHVRARQPHFDK